MKFLFTTTNHITSNLIRWGTDSDCSHFAVEFQLLTRSTIIESQMAKGVVRGSVKDFYKNNQIIHSLEYVGPGQVDQVFYDCINRHYRDRYDTSAIAFWCMASLFKRWWGMEHPKENPWGKNNRHYCVEVLDGTELLMKQYLGLETADIDWEMTSPHGAFEILRKSDNLK